MVKTWKRGSLVAAAWAVVSLAGMAQSLQAQTTIGVGNPGPVQPQQGLLGTYYNFPVATAPPPGSPPGSPATTPAPQSPITKFLERIDGPIDMDYNNPLPPGVQTDPGNAALTYNFIVVYTGFIKIDTAGSYTFGISTDDGERGWFGDVTKTTPDIEFWNQRGTPGTPDTTAAMAEVVGRIPVRVEFEQGYGGAICRVYWNPGTGTVIIPATNLMPPDGPAAPTGLTATGSTNSVTPQVSVSWNPSVAPPVDATSYILLRATAAAGPYTQVAVQPGTTFTDTTVAFGQTYYYRVQGTATSGLLVGPASAPTGGATPVQPAIVVSPAGPITTSESGTNVVLTLTVNLSPAAAGTVTISSNLPGQAIVSGQGNGDASLQGPGGSITVNINSGTPVGTTIPITVHGVDDFVANGNQNYVISFTVGGGGLPWGGATIPSVNGTNLSGDTVGLLVSPTGGLVTTSAGGQAGFAVQLNSKPAGANQVVISVVSSDSTEGTVSVGTLTFDPGNWNISQGVTITGQGVNVSFVNTPYSINLSVNAGSDPGYVGLSSSVSAMNLHVETPPALPHVWGGSSSGGKGGCGLLGLEIGLVLGLAALRRRRRA